MKFSSHEKNPYCTYTHASNNEEKQKSVVEIDRRKRQGGGMCIGVEGRESPRVRRKFLLLTRQTSFGRDRGALSWAASVRKRRRLIDIAVYTVNVTSLPPPSPLLFESQPQIRALSNYLFSRRLEALCNASQSPRPGSEGVKTLVRLIKQRTSVSLEGGGGGLENWNYKGGETSIFFGESLPPPIRVLFRRIFRATELISSLGENFQKVPWKFLVR